MKTLEILLWLLGAILTGGYALSHHHGQQLGREGLVSFAQAQQIVAAGWAGEPQREGADRPSAPATAHEPAPADAVIAVLRIPTVGLEVPVYRGTTEQVLRRGAGLVEGTPAPGSAGNVGIAAHRDTHFRGLRDVVVGDAIELDTLNRTLVYRITDLHVVDPTDVHVLDDTGETVLTLVTCYPFHFVGSAPQRYIVRAIVATALH